MNSSKKLRKYRIRKKEEALTVIIDTCVPYKYSIKKKTK